MKYIVIGLGFLGSFLATKLTSLGHDVIGIDKRPEHVDELKERITRVMIMDCTKHNALKSLPLTDVDAVIVAIGEDVGASVLILSMLRKMKVKRIIGRAINPMHQSILSELGIEEITHPEEDIANELSAMLMLKDTVNTMIINDQYIIAEIKIPAAYVGHSLAAVDLHTRFNINTVAVKSAPAKKGPGALFSRDYQVDLSCDPNRLLGEKDRLVVIGAVVDIRRFLD